MILKIDWASWAALLAVLGIVLEILRRFALMYFPSRKEFEELEHMVGRIAGSTHDNARKIKGLYDERKSFREEVLDRIDALGLRIDDLVSK
jgi:hypothetical protein